MAITTTFMTYRRLNSKFHIIRNSSSIKTNFLDPNFIPKFYGIKLAGSIFAGKQKKKNIFASCRSFPLAYLLGKASYIPECRQLILNKLPNSNLAHTLESKPYDYISDM